MSTSTQAALDFSKHIETYTRDFTGRQWLLQAIDRWLKSRDGPRAILISGEWGSGKTSLAARLCQFSLGLAESKDLTGLKPNFLSAIHFCSARNPRWNSPYAFAQSLGIQLAAVSPIYREALLRAGNDQSTNIKIEQKIDVVENKGTVIGVTIESLEVGGLTAEEAFLRVVLDPLDELSRQKPDEQIVILVDGLNEGLRYNMQTNIVSLLAGLAVLPSNVRFILTTRPEVTLLGPIQRLMPEQLSLDMGAGSEDNRDDLIHYVLSTLTLHPSLEGQVKKHFTAQEFAAAVADKSGGNFLLASLLLRNFVAGRKSVEPEFINESPAELKDMYLSVLREEFVDRKKWDESCAQVLGILAVAQEPLNEMQLAEFAGIDREKTRRLLQELLSFLDVDSSLKFSHRTYSMFNRSFTNFLLDSDQAEEFWLDSERQHRKIVDYLLSLIPTV